MLVRRTIAGSPTSTRPQAAASASATWRAVTRCSDASFALARSRAARASSSRSSSPLAVLPAIGWLVTARPARRSSSSGEAPANAVPSAPATR